MTIFAKSRRANLLEKTKGNPPSASLGRVWGESYVVKALRCQPPPNFPGFCRNCVGNVGTSVETVVETVANIVETVEYLFWGWII